MKHNVVYLFQVALKRVLVCKQLGLAVWTSPLAAMVLKLVGEPFVSAGEHSQIAYLEGTDIRLQIAEDVFPGKESIEAQQI
jgi:hypothetical protein